MTEIVRHRRARVAAGVGALAAFAALISLTACAKRSQDFSDQAINVNLLRPPHAAASVGDAPAAAPGNAGDAPAAAPVKAANPAPSGPQLAYRYDYTLTVPARRLRSLEQAHEQACAAAGPAMCQMVGSDLAKFGDTATQAHLNLRAAPSWVAHFREMVESQTNAAGGSVTNSKVSSEDLSRSIVDTQAEVRAKTTLRDRLQTILAERPGKLSDVIDAERELAKVQGELDASQSELAAMRGRVDMSDLTIEYDSVEAAPAGNLGGPLRQALAGFFANIVDAFAVIVTLVSFALPFVLVLTPIGWLILRARAGRKPKTPPEAP